MAPTILTVDQMTVTFDTARGSLDALQASSFTISEGETLGVVGESGSGKSVTSLALMGLLPENARIKAKTLNLLGNDLLTLKEREKRRLRGSDIAMIFQDPMTSLNPAFNVGYQLMETLKIHGDHGPRKKRQAHAIDLLEQVGIPAAEQRMKSYPHQLSGGMSQRVMIAMAIACKPRLLIADEPTTALDVTVQRQILDLLRQLQRDRGMAMMLITHDIGVVAEYADRILVMYAGQIVESGPTQELIVSPQHPYTSGLLDALPATHSDTEHRSRLKSIPGIVPDLVNRPSGCQLHPRCLHRQGNCSLEPPDLTQTDPRQIRCHYPLASIQTRNKDERCT